MAVDSLLLRAIGIPLLLVYIASVPLGTYNSAIEIPPDQPLTIEVNQFNITDYSLQRRVFKCKLVLVLRRYN